MSRSRRRKDHEVTGLTAAEAAARLGVKRETIYAYVSRGLIDREVASDGRTSLFDPADVDRLRRGRKLETDGELQTLITTGLTKVDDQTLWIRGHDLIALVIGGLTFTAAVDLLWDAPPGEPWITGPVVGQAEADASGSGPGGAAAEVEAIRPSLLDDLRILVAQRSTSDPLRHDLSPRGVRSVGRSLIAALAQGLPVRGPGPDTTVSDSLWRRLTAAPSDDARGRKGVRALDAAMALLIDHGLAGSTFAARIAASVRADPYSVVGAGLGVLGGTLHGAASSAVHELLVDAERSGDAATAVGAARRRLGVFPGFGHMIYELQDPRYGALMALIVEAWGDDSRLVYVYRVRDLVSERSDALPNVDLSLGALTYLARMPTDAGEVIFAIARTAGWLAHAMEEYNEKPLRFRARAKYVGPLGAP